MSIGEKIKKLFSGNVTTTIKNSVINGDMCGGSININGKSYKGNNVSMINGELYIDGKRQKGHEYSKKVEIKVEGNLEGDLKIEGGGSVEIKGHVMGDIDSNSVHITGDHAGDIDANSVTVGGDSEGNIDANSVTAGRDLSYARDYVGRGK